MYVLKNINGIATRLLSFGGPLEARGGEIIVVITGSPGIPEFYWEFAQQLHCNTQLPVCVVGHAGHDVFDQLNEQKNINTNMDEQIEHKLEFINKLIDTSNKLHIIGHSIGAWMLLELLNKNDYLVERISSVNLLFPTLQKFSQTTNGKNINNIVRRLSGLILLLFFIIQWLPAFIRLVVMRLHFMLNDWPSHYLYRVNIYLDPIVQQRSIELGCESLHRIIDLNRDAINRVKHLTNVVYSAKDGWVPMHHIQDLKNFQPHLTLKEVNVDHAFVLKYSTVVGNVVSRFIKDKINLK